MKKKAPDTYSQDTKEVSLLMPRIKKLIDAGKKSKNRHAGLALYHAKKRVALVRQQMEMLETTLKQYAPAKGMTDEKK